MDLLIAGGVFAAVIAITLVLVTGNGKDRVPAADLLEDVTRPATDAVAEGLMRTDGRPRRARATNRFEELLEMLYRIDFLHRLEENMWQAGLYLRVSEMLLIMVLLLGTGIALGKLFVGDTTVALVIGLVMSVLPIFYIRFRRQRRMRKFVLQLPFALDLIKSSLEAGHSLLRGLQVLVQEFAVLWGVSFAPCLTRPGWGCRSRALDDMLKRMPEDDLRLLVVAIKVQSEVGSSLGAIIGRLSEIVRTRQRLQQQIRTMTAQSRMSGMVVGLLPAIVLGIFSLIQPSYARVLFFDPSGVFALKLAIGLDLMAVFTIRRILRVDY